MQSVLNIRRATVWIQEIEEDEVNEWWKSEEEKENVLLVVGHLWASYVRCRVNQLILGGGICWPSDWADWLLASKMTISLHCCSLDIWKKVLIRLTAVFKELKQDQELAKEQTTGELQQNGGFASANASDDVTMTTSEDSGLKLEETFARLLRQLQEARNNVSRPEDLQVIFVANTRCSDVFLLDSILSWWYVSMTRSKVNVKVTDVQKLQKLPISKSLSSSGISRYVMFTLLWRQSHPPSSDICCRNSK